MLRGWIILVGGKVAIEQIGGFIRQRGGVVEAARLIRMSPETLRELRDLANSLPDEVVIRPGLSTWFGVILAPLDRVLLEAFIHQFRLDTQCGIVEVKQDEGVTMVRFDGGTTEEQKRIGDLLWSRATDLSQQTMSRLSPKSTTNNQSMIKNLIQSSQASREWNFVVYRRTSARCSKTKAQPTFVRRIRTWWRRGVRKPSRPHSVKFPSDWLGVSRIQLDPVPMFRKMIGPKNDES